ncbi:hypothetical protein EDC96DRAFT_459834 [Choanephora cucurbitarum]|nr:hypothetical protein EDC96DRAFT_459834 [Choanephora cucurbitarum]
MTDAKRQSMDEVNLSTTSLPPQVPAHDMEPSKSIQRSKTVRNLNTAGSKMRGLFKSNKKDSKKSEESARPPLFTSASYGAQSAHIEQKKEVAHELMEADANKSISSSKDLDLTSQQQVQQGKLQQELEQLSELIQQRTIEIQNEKRTKDRLQAELAESTRIFKERESEYSAIEHSFFEHTRAIRATDDDLSTIRDSFKLLKYSIARLVMALNKKADKAKATKKFCETWPNLPILDPVTNELEPSFINVLAEKLIHEHLVKHVFDTPIYPGLKVNDAYFALFNWLQQHQSQFSVRLRQQMAAVVAKSRPESEIQQAAAKEKQQIAQRIYDDITEIYHPFIKEHDASADEEKRYYTKICDIVDKALKLTIAIRGQEVEIKTVPIEENNKQQFEDETMTEVKGRTQGLVRFCICPAFMGGDREHGFLEKGKVVISG